MKTNAANTWLTLREEEKTNVDRGPEAIRDTDIVQNIHGNHLLEDTAMYTGGKT